MGLFRFAAGICTLGASEVVIFAGKVAAEAFVSEVKDIDAYNRQKQLEAAYNQLIKQYGRKEADRLMREAGL